MSAIASNYIHQQPNTHKLANTASKSYEIILHQYVCHQIYNITHLNGHYSFGCMDATLCSLTYVHTSNCLISPLHFYNNHKYEKHKRNIQETYKKNVRNICIQHMLQFYLIHLKVFLYAGLSMAICTCCLSFWGGVC